MYFFLFFFPWPKSEDLWKEANQNPTEMKHYPLHRGLLSLCPSKKRTEVHPQEEKNISLDVYIGPSFAHC